MPYPTEFKYTKEHEWIKADGKNGTIGITHYAQESLGDIVFVELPKVGAEISAGKTFGTVESVKAVSDLFAPATGTVTEVNGELRSEEHTSELQSLAYLVCRLLLEKKKNTNKHLHPH